MNTHDEYGGAPDERCPVLVIGGGLAGLATAVFLGLRGVRAVVAWAGAAGRVADAVGVDVHVRLVPDAGWAETGWAETAGVGTQGAVLVRPDRFVAWRSQQAPGAESLERALRAVFDARAARRVRVSTAPMEHRGGSAARAAGTGEVAGAAEVAEALAGG
jgi:threonine dehydrogenase-like Zn-dependent dehydrogenase